MFNLLIKDLLIQKKSLWYLLFYILILLLVFTSTSMDGDIAVVLCLLFQIGRKVLEAIPLFT
jgi:hypothetical protein